MSSRFAFLGLCCCIPLIGQSDAAGPAAQAPAPTSGVVFSGSVFERYEFWDWFPAKTGQTNYNYSGSLLQFAISQKKQKYDWMLDFAAPILLKLPDQAVKPAPLGMFGLGGNYYAANRNNTDAAGFFIKQGFFRLKRERTSVRLGRFEFADGMEGKPADATLKALKATRLQQRLIGIFGFSDVRRSFDGVDFERTAGAWNTTVVTSIPTRGVFQTDGWGWVKTPFVYAALTHDASYGNGNAEWRVFGIYYNDDRPVVKTDNRPAAARLHDLGGINLGTFGGDYIRDFSTSGGTFDLLGWGAVQTGTWGRLTQESAAGALEAGFQPKVLPGVKPWLRGGYFYASGDGNSSDGTHGTFVPLLPTPRLYARFPFFNEMNIRDAFGELVLRPRKSITIRSDVHGLWLANSHDLWYSGGGAFQPWTFGFSGRPSNGESFLARIYDTSADLQLTQAISFGLYFGYAQGGDVIKRIFTGNGTQGPSNGAMGFIEANYQF